MNQLQTLLIHILGPPGSPGSCYLFDSEHKSSNTLPRAMCFHKPTLGKQCPLLETCWYYLNYNNPSIFQNPCSSVSTASLHTLHLVLDSLPLSLHSFLQTLQLYCVVTIDPSSKANPWESPWTASSLSPPTACTHQL